MYNEIQPRLRVNRTSTMNITTSWQKIDFNGTSTTNINTFGKDPVSGNNMVWWDSSGKLFRFYEQNDQNYDCTMFLSTTTNLITVKATLQYRCVIPNAGGAGVNKYFPFPDDATPYVDMADATLLATQVNHKAEKIPLYLESSIRANGFWIEVKLSNSLITLGTCTLNNAAVLIQGK